MTIELIAGKTYVTRGGEEVTLEVFEAFGGNLLGTNGYLYESRDLERGHLLFPESTLESPFDIVGIKE